MWSLHFDPPKFIDKNLLCENRFLDFRQTFYLWFCHVVPVNPLLKATTPLHIIGATTSPLLTPTNNRHSILTVYTHPSSTMTLVLKVSLYASIFSVISLQLRESFWMVYVVQPLPYPLKANPVLYYAQQIIGTQYSLCTHILPLRWPSCWRSRCTPQSSASYPSSWGSSSGWSRHILRRWSVEMGWMR